MNRVARIAAHVESSVPAPLRWDRRALLVATEAEIFLLVSGSGFQELIFVVGIVRTVAGQAILDCRRVDATLDLRHVLVGVTGEAEFIRDGRDQLHARDVFVNPDLVAAETAGGHRGVDRLSLCFVFVTFEALGGVDVRLERHRMYASDSRRRGGGKHGQDCPGQAAEQEGSSAFAGFSVLPLEAEIHASSVMRLCTRVAVQGARLPFATVHLIDCSILSWEAPHGLLQNSSGAIDRELGYLPHPRW